MSTPSTSQNRDGQQGLLLLIAEDRVHGRDRDAVCEAIELTALNDGITDANLVRAFLPAWVQPQAIGATFSWLRSKRVLSPAGWTTNEDTAGRNRGKPLRTYSVNLTVLGSLSERTNVA